MTITLHRPTIEATADQPPCPPWCAGDEDCYGGDTFDFGGHVIVTNRMHTGVLVDVATDGQDGSAPQQVRVLAERCDTPDGHPGDTRLVLHVGLADRPANLTQADVDAHLAGMDRSTRDHLLAHYIAGVWNTQSAYLTDDAATAIVAALTGPVA